MAATFSTRVSEFISLSKPRIGVLVAVTTTIGFYLARGRLSVLNSDGLPSYLPWISAVVGVLLTSAGAAALNNIIDRHADAKMERTKTRALPSGRVRPLSVWIFSFATILFGYALLVFQVNLLTANLSLATVLLYVLVYTPMKRVTWLNTYVGAIPGALPAAGGWVAATGSFDFGAGILFALLFFWQMPHFYSIAWICREDYRKSGFRMLPADDESGIRTIAEVLISSVLVVWASLLPAFYGMAGNVYLIGAIVLGYLFMGASFLFVLDRMATTKALSQGQQGGDPNSIASARRLLRSSLLYLPFILILLASDNLMVSSTGDGHCAVRSDCHTQN